jgi:DNA-binding NarL/FixJ family response regulator
MMRILLVDDDQTIRDSLEIILSKTKDFHIVGKVENGQKAIDFVSSYDVDMILMDIRMPVLNGIDATAIIKSMKQEIKIIMLTTFNDFKNIHQALHAKADGYLLKTDDIEKQITTIQNVYLGQAVLSDEVLKMMTSSEFIDSLTERENSCLELIAHGYSNKEISQKLWISEGSVRNVISVILDKLNLRDRTQLAIYYWQTKHDKK